MLGKQYSKFPGRFGMCLFLTCVVCQKQWSPERSGSNGSKVIKMNTVNFLEGSKLQLQEYKLRLASYFI